MGNHTAGELIVIHTGYLAEHRTNESALEILDLAVERAKASDSFSPDVEFDDDDATDTPLGRLIFEAFAPNGIQDIEEYERLNNISGNEDDDKFYELADATYGEFRKRYDLC